MDIKGLTGKLQSLAGKYKYAIIILIIGLVLMLLPGKTDKSSPSAPEKSTEFNSLYLTSEALSKILQSVEGAGRVQVLLSPASGEKTLYQTNSDTNISGKDNDAKIETVIISDSQRNETGLITQINPPTYLGAIVVCEGADSASVRLAITQAVIKITGLNADKICVLKMGINGGNAT